MVKMFVTEPRAYLIGRPVTAGGLLRCTVLSVCPCVVSFFKLHEHVDTHDLLRISR